VNVDRVLGASLKYETPFAVVDEEAMEDNLAKMAATAKAAGLRLRPHAKTHKSAFVARRQIAHGATGLTVATLREAEVLADAGVDDMLLGHPPVGAAKLRRVEALAARVRRLAVSLDHVDVARTLPPTVEVLWEVDSGHHRVGTEPGESTAAAVGDLLNTIAAERFRGLLTFPGHAYGAEDDTALRHIAEQEWTALTASAASLAERGIAVAELSVGSTPTAGWAQSLRGATEMRPGSYVYGDAQQVALGSQRLDECALAVVATVVSTPTRRRAVIDAGSKALSSDIAMPRVKTFGLITGRDDFQLQRLSEEHGVIVSDKDTDLRIGDRLVVIPTHCCTTVNLHPDVLMVGKTEAHWDPVSARGWSRPREA
jgi:D-serine deaminase-like pyridoxal phosphate-dependent protein